MNVKPQVDGYYGIAAVMLWGISIPLGRIGAEGFGPITTITIVQALGGTMLLLSLRTRTRKALPSLSKQHIICGLCFAGYMALFYLAIGGVPNREEVVAVGLINYLWPCLAVISITTIGPERATLKRLLIGCFLTLAGAFTALAPYTSISSLTLNPEVVKPFCYAALGAFFWALYCGFTARWGSGKRASIACYMIFTSLILFTLRGAFNEASTFEWSSLAAVLVLSCSTSSAYVLWDLAMSAKNRLTSVALANYLPLVSAVFITAGLRTTAPAAIWIAAGLITAGVVVMRKSIQAT